MVRRLVRADGRGDPRRRARAKEQLMFDFLARLANGSARRVALLALAFFVVAGALGGSVASRLDPYGADDPATETVRAMDRLQGAGLRGAAVGARGGDAPGSRKRVGGCRRSSPWSKTPRSRRRRRGGGSRRWKPKCAGAATSPRSAAT